ncbi:MAG: SPW repeat protein [Halobacteriaceae archaeon]
MPDGPPPAWLVALLGVWTVISPFVLGATSTTHTASLVVAGILVAALAAYRGMYADEDVPLPALPVAIVVLGLWLIADPFVLGDGTGSTLGLVTVVVGVIVALIPAVMIVQLLREESEGEASAA